jgi:hypothetical protein
MLYGLKPTDPFTLRGTFLMMLRVSYCCGLVAGTKSVST